MAINNYKRGDSTKLSANFRASEFLCKGAGCCTHGQIDDKLVQILQKIRDHFGKPVHISSAYRCATWNKQVGGVSNSYHCYGQAADIKVEDTAPAEVAKYAESIGVLGIGLYETDSDGHFVHVDTRTTKSFWYGQAGKKRTTFGGAAKNTTTTTTKGDYTMEMRNLKKGMTGEDVRALQILLNGRKYECGNADGYFGAKTEGAVIALQKDVFPNDPSEWDGIAGKNTMGSLLGAG